MACRSRSKLDTKSSETVLFDGMMAISFGQFATYEVLRCGYGEVLPTENGRRLFHYGKEKERRKDDDRSYDSQPEMVASSKTLDNEAARQPCGRSSSCGRLSTADMRDGRRHPGICSYKPPRQTSCNAAHGKVEMK